MIDFFNKPLNVLHLSSLLLWTGLVVLLAGAIGAYGFERQFALPLLVLLHAMVIIGPTTIKIGYVMRILAQHNLSNPHSRLSHAHAV